MLNLKISDDFLTRDEVGGILSDGGMSSKYQVTFTKENGDMRTILGVLVKPIEGPLGTNVALVTNEGYKSFNTGRVTYIGARTGETNQ